MAKTVQRVGGQPTCSEKAQHLVEAFLTDSPDAAILQIQYIATDQAFPELEDLN